MPAQQDSQATRILILGGGFAGVYTAKYLERLVRKRQDIEITIVNQENYFVFQPLLAEVVSGNIGLLDMVNPIRRILPRSRLYVRAIDSVDLAEQTATLTPGFRPRADVVRYDHLVLALGSVTDFRGIAGLHEHALPFKTLADAVFLRNHLLHVLEEASIEEDEELRQQLLTFVVAGGGFSGVEVAAEMNDFLRRVAKQYRQIDARSIRVLLVHSGDRVLNRELSAGLSQYATNVLQKRGVELRLGRRLKTASVNAAVLDDGERILTRTLVSTVPSSPNPLIESLDLASERGKVKVDRQLQVEGQDNVWALGDCALVPSGTEGEFCPPTAQHASRQAQILAHNIATRVRGGQPKQFSFSGLGKMGSVGHHCAVAEVLGGIKISGFPAWFMWRTVYWWKLPGIVRKIRVGVAWALDLVIPADSVQLRLTSSAGVTQAHFEPGETVFRQGDLGDALYIILDGSAEVVLESNGDQEVIATLAAGDYFGEQALLNNRTRAATVRCVRPMNVLALRKGDFSALTNNLPDMHASFERVMKERMVAQQDIANRTEGDSK